MKPLFKCELSYFPHTHLSPLYAGFELLKKNGIIDISLMPYKGDTRIPLLKLKIDNKYTVIYDTLDGFNWINGSIQENLNHFKANTKADFYFKRGFSKDIVVYTPSNCRVYPLGFNYPIKTIDWPPKEMKEILKEFIKSNYFTSRCLKISKNSFYSKYFEHYPLASRENQILYVVSLKNPEEATLEHLKIERETLNAKRIEYIRFCKKEFGERFIGGLVKDDFSSKNNADLLMSYSLTKKEFYLKSVKESSICIASAGLHGSTGWKFGEYVAASRAIVTEPLEYEVPGNFQEGKNYLAFENIEGLSNNIYYLLKNKDALSEMMLNNYNYYNNYLRPDMLILNTLLITTQFK